MHESSECPICQQLPADGSLTDEQFSAFMDSCQESLADLQNRFFDAIPDDAEWSYDLESGQFQIDGKSYPFVVIGSHNEELNTWLWGWANESLPSSARQSSKTIQQLQQLTGSQVFVDEGLEAGEADAEALSAMAVHVLGARGLFLCRGEANLYLALL